MYAIVSLALKDLLLLTRDYAGLFWIFVFPLMFALFFGAIFQGQGSGGGSALVVALADEDQSEGSKAFAERLEKSPALSLRPMDRAEARERVLAGKLVAYVFLKKGFGDTVGFMGGTEPFVEVGIDPSRKAEKEMLRGVLMEASFAGMQDLFGKPEQATKQMDKARKQIAESKDLDEENKKALNKLFGGLEEYFKTARFDGVKGKDGKAPQGFQGMAIDVHDVTVDRRGPRSSWEITFPSAVLWGIIGCVTTFAIGLVTERTQGTLLRLRVAPVSRGQILAGKGLACFLACVCVAVVLLSIATVILGVRLQDPVQLVMAIVCTAVCFVGMMMLISTLGKTEPAVAGAGWGMLMPLAMLGGGMVPLFAMPSWMQTASNVSPVKWGIIGLEGAVWRGYSLADMVLPCAVLVCVGVACFAVGVWNLTRQEG